MVDQPPPNFDKALKSFQGKAPETPDNETWQDKALREVQLVGTGLAGFGEAAKRSVQPEHLGETAGKVAFSAAAGFAIARYAPEVGVKGLMARSAGIGMGASFAYDVAANGGQIAGAVGDTWRSDRNWQKNTETMRQSLGQFAFDTALMTAGGVGGAKLTGVRPFYSARASEAIPAFGRDGFLPAGDHRATWPEFSKRFGTNATRLELLSSLEMAAGHVRNAGGTEITVGGSFVSSKAKPGDFDASYNSSGVDKLNLPPDIFGAVPKSISALGIKGELYPAEHHPPDLGPWLQALGKNRDGKAVGTVTIDLNTIPVSPGKPGTIESFRADNQRTTEIWAEQARKKAAADAAGQIKIDELVRDLPGVLRGKDEAVVGWLASFSAVNENAKFDGPAIAKTLTAAGYKANENTAPGAVKDRASFSRWYIGQAVHMLASGETIPGHFGAMAGRLSNYP